MFDQKQKIAFKLDQDRRRVIIADPYGISIPETSASLKLLCLWEIRADGRYCFELPQQTGGSLIGVNGQSPNNS